MSISIGKPFLFCATSLTHISQFYFTSLLHQWQCHFISVSVMLLNSRPSWAVTLRTLSHCHIQTDTCWQRLSIHRQSEGESYQCNLAGELADPWVIRRDRPADTLRKRGRDKREEWSGRKRRWLQCLHLSYDTLVSALQTSINYQVCVCVWGRGGGVCYQERHDF